MSIMQQKRKENIKTLSRYLFYDFWGTKILYTKGPILTVFWAVFLLFSLFFLKFSGFCFFLLLFFTNSFIVIHNSPFLFLPYHCSFSSPFPLMPNKEKIKQNKSSFCALPFSAIKYRCKNWRRELAGFIIFSSIFHH